MKTATPTIALATNLTNTQKIKLEGMVLRMFKNYIFFFSTACIFGKLSRIFPLRFPVFGRTAMETIKLMSITA